MLLSFAVPMSVYMNAARSPPRSEPANSHAFLPRATPRSARSAALLVRQIRPSSRNRGERGPVLEHIVDRARDRVVACERGTLIERSHCSRSRYTSGTAISWRTAQPLGDGRCR